MYQHLNWTWFKWENPPEINIEQWWVGMKAEDQGLFTCDYSIFLTHCNLLPGGQPTAAGGWKPWGGSSSRGGGLPWWHAAGEDPECPCRHCPISAPHPQRGTQPDIPSWILTCKIHNSILDTLTHILTLYFYAQSATTSLKIFKPLNVSNVSEWQTLDADQIRTGLIHRSGYIQKKWKIIFSCALQEIWLSLGVKLN